MRKNILLLLLLISFTSFSQELVIASYNIRMNTPSDGVNAWPNRKEMVKGLVRFHEWDIFGIQEGFRGQMDDLLEMNEFAATGKGRDDGKSGGEHSSIFYKKDRFQILKSGDFWLSETPDVPGKGWDATCCNRICSWAQFKDKTTRKNFYVFNVHFDHQGVEARRQSGHLMVKKIKDIAGEKATVFLTGDFNSTPDTEQIQLISKSLNDSYKVSEQPPYGPEGTFNSFKFDAPMENRIDYIFTSPNIRVLKYGVLTDALHQRYPSDHQPVMIKAMFRE